MNEKTEDVQGIYLGGHNKCSNVHCTILGVNGASNPSFLENVVFL